MSSCLPPLLTSESCTSPSRPTCSHTGAQGSGKGFAHSVFMQMQVFCFIIKLLPPSSSLKNIYFMYMHVLSVHLSMHHVHS